MFDFDFHHISLNVDMYVDIVYGILKQYHRGYNVLH